MKKLVPIQKANKNMTDRSKRKAVKLVISHKKECEDFVGIDLVNEWIGEMDKLLENQNLKLLSIYE